MKIPFNRALSLLLAGIAILLGAGNCKKSSNNGNAALSASVSGKDWTANYPVRGTYLGGQFEIGGLRVKGGDSTVLGLIFTAPVVLNKPVSSDTSQIDVASVDNETKTEYDGSTPGHSIITIISYDSASRKIAGTFTGVLYNDTNGADSLIVTGGVFSASYTVQ